MKFLYITLYILYTSGFDSYFYGRGEEGHFKWLFKYYLLFGIEVPLRYRVIQKINELSGIAAIYFLLGPWGVLACLIAHYFMVLDRIYYILNRQETSLQCFEEYNIHTDWLCRWWFSGKWFFRNGFTVSMFNLSAVTGLIVSYVIIAIFT